MTRALFRRCVVLVLSHALVAHAVSEDTLTQRFLDKELLRSIGSVTKATDVASTIKAGANIDARDPGGNTALLLAAAKNNHGVVELLIKQGASIDATNADGWTALIVAAHHGFNHIVELLLDHGADFSIKFGDDETALSRALEEQHSRVSDLLIRAERYGWPKKEQAQVEELADPFAEENGGPMARLRRGYGARSVTKEEAAAIKEEL